MGNRSSSKDPSGGISTAPTEETLWELSKPKVKWTWYSSADLTKRVINEQLNDFRFKGYGGVYISLAYRSFGDRYKFFKEWSALIGYCLDRALELKMTCDFFYDIKPFFGGACISEEDAMKSISLDWWSPSLITAPISGNGVKGEKKDGHDALNVPSEHVCANKDKCIEAEKFLRVHLDEFQLGENFDLYDKLTQIGWACSHLQSNDTAHADNDDESAASIKSENRKLLDGDIVKFHVVAYGWDAQSDENNLTFVASTYGEGTDEEEPISYCIGTPSEQVIEGLREAFSSFSVGDIFELLVESKKAYGENGKDGVLPHSNMLLRVFITSALMQKKKIEQEIVSEGVPSRNSNAQDSILSLATNIFMETEYAIDPSVVPLLSGAEKKFVRKRMKNLDNDEQEKLEPNVNEDDNPNNDEIICDLVRRFVVCLNKEEKSNDTQTIVSPPVIQNLKRENSFVCLNCAQVNKGDAEKCFVCGTERDDPSENSSKSENCDSIFSLTQLHTQIIEVAESNVNQKLVDPLNPLAVSSFTHDLLDSLLSCSKKNEHRGNIFYSLCPDFSRCYHCRRCSGLE